MKALLLIDIQNDFLPGGALAVPDGDAIIPRVNSLLSQYPLVVATQDWHPSDHGSFAVNHPGAAIFSQGTLAWLPQTLWPVHCVEHTPGAAFAPTLNAEGITRVFPKGIQADIDSYSGFFDNGHRAETGLHAWLQQQGVTELHIAGLATDYCVKFTVLDALQLGYRVQVLVDACRGVNLQPGDVERALEQMKQAGATCS
jgi:nicotinamidase/pyrazinamidase